MVLPIDTLLPVLPSARGWALHDAAGSRQVERAALATTAPHALMARAGLAVARLALATVPHARAVWVACGPGNNGGDGLVAARHLHQAGKHVQVHLLGDPTRAPDDARDALAQAQAAGVTIHPGLPPQVPEADLAVDALLGLGSTRAPEGALARAVGLLGAGSAPVLAIDLPTGLHADTGALLGPGGVRAAHTLCLLTLKPGLFTAAGRDHAGRVWLDTLGVDADALAPSAAWLAGPRDGAAAHAGRRHAHHKGSFGDVVVVGGAPGMAGAARLAAGAALAAGAGRVYLAALDAAQSGQPDPLRPELMPRPASHLLVPGTLAQATVVCGCGGGDAVRDVLPPVLHHAARLVLDADALNVLAHEPALRRALASRQGRGLSSVVTPHPLEAARLLSQSTAQVQTDRLAAAQTLADALQCTVVLKGSGTVTASPDRRPTLNPTGNARLASPGTGDVLAGWLGGAWSHAASLDPHDAAVATAWLHGHAAEAGDGRLPLRAADLIGAMGAALPDVGLA